MEQIEGSVFHPIDIDESHDEIKDLQIIPDINMHTCSKNINKKSRCLGLLIVLPENQSPFTSYPWAIHSQTNYPWIPEIHNTKLYLRSEECVSEEYSIPCKKCAALDRHQTVCLVRQRMDEGAPEHTPWFWLSISQIYNREARLRNQINTQKLNALNAARALGHRN
jgi:hypothetical protein